MINPGWGWNHSHKFIRSDSRRELLGIYRELGWSSHRKYLLDNKDLPEKEIAELFKEVVWHCEDRNLEETETYKTAKKRFEYMSKHKEEE
tara:strand:+ start:31 stop:300 length:270 start_codon:yes stop_codon:yes gene_type:complete